MSNTNWDDFTPVQGAKAPASAAPATNWDDFSPVEGGGTVSDLGKSLKAGVQRLPGMATGLADLPIALATGTRPFTTAADYLGKATGFQPGKWADETNFSQGYQDSKKSVDEAWKGFDDVSKDQSTSKMDAVRKLVSDAPQIAGAYLQNPNYTLGQVAESVPGIFAGGALSKVALGVGRVAGVAADAAAGTAARAAVPGALARTVGDKWAVPVAAGLGEGAVTAGGAMANAQGEDQQKNALAALGAGLGTALIGAGSGRIANALGLETAETALARAGTRAANGAVTPPASVLRRVLGGMVSEAVLQELPQSAQEQMWQNFAEGKPLWSGVARAGTEGALAGGVLGAAANIRGGQAAPPPPPQDLQARSNAEAAAADAQARADAALPPWDTLPGAADPSAVRATGAASAANAPGVEGADFGTSPGAAAPSANGMDFTRDVDTAGLSLQDPAELERQRAATIDYDPVDTTPAWDTQPGATSPAGGGLDLPAESIDTGALAISDRPLSEKMGLNPAAGALSAAAVQAVDSGAYTPPAEMPGTQPAAAPEADPMVLQNRDRTSAASIAQMQEIAANPDYLRVGPSRDMTSGAPIVFGEMPPTAILGRAETVVDGKGERMGTQYAVVDAGDLIASNNADGTTVAEYATGQPGKLRSVAGNGRTAGLQAAYQKGTATQYQRELANDAEALGINAEALLRMKRPVLVRVMRESEVTSDMGDRTNITATQKLSPLEQAGNDARRLDVRTLSFDEGGNPTSDSIKGFVSAMPATERGDMLNADGTPTRQAMDRLMAATFKQAYESDELVQLYAQATDPDARAVMAAAADASGVLANLKGAGEFDVRAAVADAAKMAVNAARQGLKLSDVLRNADLDISPEAFPVAAFMANNIRSPKQMAEGLRRWGQLALEQARIAEENTVQGGLMGPRPTLTRAEIFARIGDGANPAGQSIAPPAAGQPAAAPVQQSTTTTEGTQDGPAPNQAQQAIAQPAQAAAPAVAPQSGQSAAPAPRGANWRSNTIQAGRVARELGLNPQGKKLEQMVQEIDAFDSQQNQAEAQDGTAPAAIKNVASEDANKVGRKLSAQSAQPESVVGAQPKPAAVATPEPASLKEGLAQVQAKKKSESNQPAAPDTPAQAAIEKIAADAARRAERIAGALSSGGYVQGRELRTNNGMALMRLNENELASIPESAIRQPPTPAQMQAAATAGKTATEPNAQAAPRKAGEAADDLDAMFDDLMAETAPVAPTPRAPRAAPKASTGAPQATAPKPRTGTQAAASAVKNTAAALNSAIDGLGALFGAKSGGRMGSGLSFDENTYAQAKPLFIQAVSSLKNASADIREAMRAVIQMVTAKFGREVTENMKPYIVRFASDVRDGTISQEELNAPSTDASVERDSQVPATEPAVGDAVQDDAGAADPGAKKAGGRTSRSDGGGQQDGAGVPFGSAPVAGERGDQPVSAGNPAPELESILAGSDFSEPGGDSGIEGVPPDSIPAAKVAATADQSATGLKAGIERTRADKVPVKLRDIDNIRATLPQLLPGQQDDVLKAETRFADPKGYGILFTNGTGTGKTFSGLGVVKRFARQGKSNTLIVVPDDKIASDWVQSAKLLGLDVSALKSTQDAGTGIVITSYANLGANDALASRQWDLVVADEAHTLMQSADGEVTGYLRNMRAITSHPDGIFTRYEMLNREKLEQQRAINEKIKNNNKDMSAADTMPGAVAAMRAENARLSQQELALGKELRAAMDEVTAQVKASQGAPRTRMVALSATPFAYEKTVDWANGYLFDYAEGYPYGENSTAYNEPNPREHFFMTRFGYRMRYNKLTAPDAKVDSGLMQRQFNGSLKKAGALSGRMLDVAPDYDRRFVLVQSAIGNRIDEALEWLTEQSRSAAKGDGGMSELSKAINDQFKYLQKRYLLEAIKATEVVPIVKQHMAMGRKVVVFHDYKKGGGFNPFKVTIGNAVPTDAAAAVSAGQLKAAIAAFNAEFADLVNQPFGNMDSPIEVFRREIPGVLLVNGDEKKADLLARYKSFQDDGTGPQVMLVQSAKNKGWSGHDTTGKHQRVLINLGQPTAPTLAIQQEGRIYRTGQASDAIMRYLNTGTNWERWTFASTIASRASTAENLGMGEMARALKDSFIQSFEESDAFAPGHEGEGKGGKARDAAANNALTEYDRAKALYFANAKKTSRTKAQEGVDYFATPEPVGLKMVEWLDARSGESVLEPSGGHGAIARWFPEKTDKTVIEPSLALRSRLALAMNAQEDRIIAGTFEDHGVNNKYDGIAMNPPFGVGGKTAIEHLAKAATHLREGGRIVALIPVGPMADKRFDKWMYEASERPAKPLYVHPEHGPIYRGDTLTVGGFGSDSSIVVAHVDGDSAAKYVRAEGVPKSQAVNAVAIRKVSPTGQRTEAYSPAADLHLVASILLPQSTFERAGTAVMTRIVVIEKQAAQPAAAAASTRNMDLTGTEDTARLFDRLEGLSLPGRAKTQEPEPAEQPKPAGKNTERNEKARAQSTSEGNTVTLAGKAYPISTYTTNAGKEIRGAWVKTQQTALQFGPRTFQKKPLGWFVREKDFPSGAVSQAEGADPAFSRSSPAPTAQSNERLVATQMLVDGLKANWTRAPEVIVARNMQDPQVPQRVRDYDARLNSQGASGEARGFIYGGKVYLLSDKLGDPKEIAETLFHEVLGHHGLRGAFGEALAPILNQVATMRKADIAAKAREYGLFDKAALGGMTKAQASDAQVLAAMSEAQKREAAEEVLAEMAQTAPGSGFVQRAISAIRNWLRANVPGFKGLALTDADIIEAFIIPARGFVTRSKETGEQSIERAMTAFSRVWHGSPHKFLQFDSSKIGTGEGAQAYGHGLYLADSQAVAGSYQQKLSGILGNENNKVLLDGSPINFKNAADRRAWEIIARDGRKNAKDTERSLKREGVDATALTAALSASKGKLVSIERDPGTLYQVDLPDKYITKMLDWDKPLSEQPHVMKALDRLGIPASPAVTGGELIRGSLLKSLTNDDGILIRGEEALRSKGIPGIRYLDDGSRDNSAGSSSYVIFPGMEKILTILNVNGDPVAGAERAKVLGEQMDLAFSRAPTAIESSMGALTPDQDAAYKKVAGVQKVPTLKERADAFKANLGLRMKQALVDQFAPIKDVSQEAYMLARMSKGSDGAVDALLMYGKPFLRDGVLDVNTQDGGFAQVMAGLKGEHDRFFMWVAAQRAERLKAEGKENLMGDSDISALKTLNAGKMTDGTVRVPIYARALQELNAFNESSLKVALQSGLIDQDAYDLMRDQPYVPFYRLMEDEASMTGPRFSSGLRNQQAWKKLKGGTQQLNADLMQNALQNWSHLYAASARNRAALATMDAAEALGVAYKVPSTTKGASKVMRDGKTEYWAVEDPYLLEAISALNYSASPLMKPLAKMKQILTFGVTVNPTFKIRNLIRDSLSSISQSELGYNPLKNVGQGWALTAKDSQVYASMLASGGVMRFGSQERTNQLRDQVQKLGGVVLDEGGLKKFTGQLKSLYDAYADFGDRTENVNRAALYDQLIKKGHNHAEASFMARDLMDFSMGGSHPAVRFLTQSVPFLNARLQGLYKLGRAASEDPRKFATVAGAVSLASLALLGAYSDDEDWKKREDWDRDAYWWFKVGGTAYRIPKPFELGAIGTLAERTAEAMFDEEMTGKRFMQRIGHMAGQTFSLDPVPQAFKPLLDIYANKDSFTGRAIESQADRRLRPQDRYNERTSEVARLLGSMGLPEPSQLIKGDYSPLSPKQVDHLIRGYFSWLGTATSTVSDFALRPAMDRGERPDLRLRDVFLAGNFVEALPTGSSRYVSQMYEQSRKVEQAFASYREALKQGDMEKAADIKEQSGDKLRNRVAYATATKRMAEINAQVKRIEASRVLSGEAKRGRLNELEAARGKIAQRVAQLT